ncbi:MAG: hypothetical protein Q7R96_02405 [Nanoarchaeota archaeon]|nr:hypothetical protein [Nanoarchaeota archaeon]
MTNISLATDKLLAHLTTQGMPETPARRTIITYLLEGSFVHVHINAGAAEPKEKAAFRFATLQHLSKQTGLDYALVLDLTEELEGLGFLAEQPFGDFQAHRHYYIYGLTKKAEAIYQ